MAKEIVKDNDHKIGREITFISSILFGCLFGISVPNRWQQNIPPLDTFLSKAFATISVVAFLVGMFWNSRHWQLQYPRERTGFGDKPQALRIDTQKRWVLLLLRRKFPNSSHQ